ncbi:hypothetical protein HPB52_022284 [Rhipicephalus sanguineus]|uniref:Uncharacterized protein n=1 Tax=Rhipicephalus sanguineus TaxID=34632 RepID=A0A9D4TBT1_RHISA|nr:hypothetical protein HPB52_022284 [Rhipicephalus sanguineus]
MEVTAANVAVPSSLLYQEERTPETEQQWLRCPAQPSPKVFSISHGSHASKATQRSSSSSNQEGVWGLMQGSPVDACTGCGVCHFIPFEALVTRDPYNAGVGSRSVHTLK